MDSVTIWMDYVSIDQTDTEAQQRGIDSLLSYATHSNFVLIPAGYGGTAVKHLKACQHPMDLPNYGERAWTRLEIFAFACLAQIKGRGAQVYGVAVKRVRRPPSPVVGQRHSRVAPHGDPSPERWGRWHAPAFGGRDLVIRPLMSSLTRTEGELRFAGSELPSAGEVTVEADRGKILQAETSVRSFYVRKVLDGEIRRIEKSAGRATRHLICERCQVADDQMPYLCQSLTALPCFARVESINLGGNLIGDEGIATLFEEVVCTPEAKSLVKLVLDQNPKLGVAGLSVIAKCLGSDRCHLQHLCLRECGISNEGASALAHGVAVSPALRFLDVSYNELTDSGIQLLQESAVPRLRALSLDAVGVRLHFEGNKTTKAAYLAAARSHLNAAFGYAA